MIVTGKFRMSIGRLRPSFVCKQFSCTTHVKGFGITFHVKSFGVTTHMKIIHNCMFSEEVRNWKYGVENMETMINWLETIKITKTYLGRGSMVQPTLVCSWTISILFKTIETIRILYKTIIILFKTIETIQIIKKTYPIRGSGRMTQHNTHACS